MFRWRHVHCSRACLLHDLVGQQRWPRRKQHPREHAHVLPAEGDPRMRCHLSGRAANAQGIREYQRWHDSGGSRCEGAIPSCSRSGASRLEVFAALIFCPGQSLWQICLCTRRELEFPAVFLCRVFPQIRTLATDQDTVHQCAILDSRNASYRPACIQHGCPPEPPFPLGLVLEL